MCKFLLQISTWLAKSGFRIRTMYFTSWNPPPTPVCCPPVRLAADLDAGSRLACLPSVCEASRQRRRRLQIHSQRSASLYSAWRQRRSSIRPRLIINRPDLKEHNSSVLMVGFSPRPWFNTNTVPIKQCCGPRGREILRQQSPCSPSRIRGSLSLCSTEW